MTDFLFFFATCLFVVAALWTLIVITLGDSEGRRRRDNDILRALDDLHRELGDLRRRTLNRHDP